MPRDDTPTPFRRFMMQAIMWIILGATVAAAAFMNQTTRRALNPPLGEPVQVRGISVSLPRGWEKGEEETASTLVRRDPKFGKFGNVLVVSVRQLGLGERLGLSQDVTTEQGTFVEEIDLGGEPTKLMLQRISAGGPEGVPELTVTRRLPRARELSISIIVPGAARRGQLSREIDLIKRVAASVQIDGNQ